MMRVGVSGFLGSRNEAFDDGLGKRRLFSLRFERSSVGREGNNNEHPAHGLIGAE